MRNLELDAKLSSAVLELKHASGIPCCQYMYMRSLDCFHLSIQDFHRKLILRNVVNSSASATLISTLNLDKFNSWNGFQQSSRLGTNSLSMDQMARIVVTDPSFQPNL